MVYLVASTAIVAACVSCSFLLSVSQWRVPVFHYLELLFGQTIDWPQVFAQLGGMWEGEYGPWLTQTFFA